MAKIVKSVKVWSPPSQPTGRKMENSWYPKIFESKISLLYSGNYKYNHQKCVSKTISHHMRPKAQKYSKISPKVCSEEKTQNYVGLWNKVWNICFTPSSFVAKKAPFSMCIWQNINVNYSGTTVLKGGKKIKVFRVGPADLLKRAHWNKNENSGQVLIVLGL